MYVCIIMYTYVYLIILRMHTCVRIQKMVFVQPTHQSDGPEPRRICTSVHPVMPPSVGLRRDTRHHCLLQSTGALCGGTVSPEGPGGKEEGDQQHTRWFKMIYRAYF